MVSTDEHNTRPGELLCSNCLSARETRQIVAAMLLLRKAFCCLELYSVPGMYVWMVCLVFATPLRNKAWVLARRKPDLSATHLRCYTIPCLASAKVEWSPNPALGKPMPSCELLLPVGSFFPALSKDSETGTSSAESRLLRAVDSYQNHD